MRLTCVLRCKSDPVHQTKGAMRSFARPHKRLKSVKIAHKLHLALCSHTSTPSCLPFPHIQTRLVCQKFAKCWNLRDWRSASKLVLAISFSGEPLRSYKYIILGGKRVATTSFTDILIRGHFIHNLHRISFNNRCPSKEGRSPLDWRTPLNGGTLQCARRSMVGLDLV